MNKKYWMTGLLAVLLAFSAGCGQKLLLPRPIKGSKVLQDSQTRLRSHPMSQLLIRRSMTMRM
ncbi:hypothetical protein JCM10914_799 [Paenibacillus sp. JCM 10914]|nr:hypothetical protein [Paenibacillus sp. JCM 10914]GAE04743.1 hypothetical protein JCM10914_799 [Paenibacillus sp. JCM 10914]